jgi:hypothetical protein
MLSENNKSDSVLDPDDYDISQEISMESLIAMNADIDINKIINNMNNVLNVFNETEIFEKKKISK